MRDRFEQASAAATLSAVEAEALLRCSEGAIELRRRHQFFIWSQASLQQLLPHQLAVCASYSRQRRALDYEVFNCVPLPADALQALRAGALMEGLQARWLQSEAQPLLLALTELSALPGWHSTAEALQAAGFRGLALHGTVRAQAPQEIESFFGFATTTSIGGARQALVLQLLMPVLHAAWMRVHAQELLLHHSLAPSTPGGPSHGVTAREREVLVWMRDGKSNQEIARLMGISALTVKNHVQKILRKLAASNRAQAVAQAMALKLVGQPGAA